MRKLAVFFSVLLLSSNAQNTERSRMQGASELIYQSKTATAFLRCSASLVQLEIDFEGVDASFDLTGENPDYRRLVEGVLYPLIRQRCPDELAQLQSAEARQQSPGITVLNYIAGLYIDNDTLVERHSRAPGSDRPVTLVRLKAAKPQIEYEAGYASNYSVMKDSETKTRCQLHPNWPICESNKRHQMLQDLDAGRVRSLAELRRIREQMNSITTKIDATESYHLLTALDRNSVLAPDQILKGMKVVAFDIKSNGRVAQSASDAFAKRIVEALGPLGLQVVLDTPSDRFPRLNLMINIMDFSSLDSRTTGSAIMMRLALEELIPHSSQGNSLVRAITWEATDQMASGPRTSVSNLGNEAVNRMLSELVTAYQKANPSGVPVKR